MKEKSFNKEHLILDHPFPVSLENTKKIIFQMQNCICQIFKNGLNGTGFFCKIPFNNNYLPVLITNNHILKEEDIDNNKNIELSFLGEMKKINKKIIINDSRKKYTNPDIDISIIEMKPEDGIKDYLEIDDDDTNNEFLESEYKNKSVYIVHYPKGELSVSYGVIKDIIDEKRINHLCSTEEGSSGSPILSLKTLKIIGIHCGGFDNSKFNSGIFIRYAIKEFIENNFKAYGETKIILNNNRINQNSNHNVNNNTLFLAIMPIFFFPFFLKMKSGLDSSNFIIYKNLISRQ